MGNMESDSEQKAAAFLEGAVQVFVYEYCNDDDDDDEMLEGSWSFC